MDSCEAYEIIDGCLLGDGSLAKSAGPRSGYFRIGLSGEEHLDWLYIIKSALEVIGVKVSRQYPRTATRTGSTGKEYQAISLVSRVHPILGDLRSKWYKGRVKVLPEDLVLTPRKVAHWFMGDGSSSRYSASVQAAFHTEGFSIDEAHRLTQLLAELGVTVGLYYYEYKGGPLLQLTHAASVARLMGLVEPFILPSYQYKVKYPRVKRREVVL